jgi:zinc transport system permease protein
LDPFFLQLIVGILIGLGAGYVGSFMVLRRMSLVGDALSHVALPGIALSLLLSINPFFGAFSALFLAVILIWFLEKKTELPSETLVGILFTTALALGLILTPEPELLEALFGDITKVTSIDVAIMASLVVLIFLIMKYLSHKLMLGIISRDLAKSSGIAIEKVNLIFLVLVCLIVALGLKVTGTLLMGALVIIPAAAAKNISVNLSSYTKLSCVFGIISALSGVAIAAYFGLMTGPIIVLSAGVIFLGTLFFKAR